MNVLMECLSFVTHALVDCSSFFSFLIPPPPPPPPPSVQMYFLSSFVPFFPSPNICFLEAQAGSAPLVGNFPCCIQNLSFFFFFFFGSFTIGTSFYGLSVVLLENDYRKNILEVEFIFSVRGPLYYGIVILLLFFFFLLFFTAQW